MEIKNQEQCSFWFSFSHILVIWIVFSFSLVLVDE